MTTRKTTTKKATKKAARKATKKATKKATSNTAKRATKKAATKTVKQAAKKAPKKAAKKATKKRAMPPMHAGVNHPELDDEDHGNEVFEIFRSYDRNHSGSIDRGELAHLLEALGGGLSEEELTIALGEIDANHSGKISWKEFKTWWLANGG